jgi:transcriptional regulator with XRE-family HTH domain
MRSQKLAMKSSFRHALLWHMDRHDTGVAELARGAGVSPDIIKKVRARDHASTNAETAEKVAGFYGKSLAEFLRCDEASESTIDFAQLTSTMTEEQRKFLLQVIRTMLNDLPKS